MADLREQINTARRAGYSESEIVDFLKQSRQDVSKAIESGYSPDEVLKFLAPKPTLGEEFVRKASIAARGAAPIAGSAALGGAVGTAFGGPGVGTLVGSLAVPAADVLASTYSAATGRPVSLPSNVLRDLIPGPRAQTPVERMVQAGGEAAASAIPQVAAGRALAAAGGPAAAMGQAISRQPIGQIVTAPAAGAAAQGVGEATGSPLAGLLAGTAVGAAGGVRRTQREPAPTEAELSAQSKANYDILDQSGLRMDTPEFRRFAQSLSPQLRADVGYTPSAYPKITAALKEMSSHAPKDVAEIQALRKIISGARGSADAQERMIASELLDRFDDYLLNAPPQAIVGGNPDAIKAWGAARLDYSRMKKSEIFTDMIGKAELSQSGKGAAMASELSKLARNDRKMRLFTPEEQEAIKDAARGGKVKDMLNIAAKFTPMTPAAAIFTAVAPGGAIIAAGGLSSREMASKLTQRDLERLATQMRLGRPQNMLQGATAGVPISAARGVVSSTPFLTQEIQNQLAPSPKRNALAE
jgi:hypothetical protein